MNYLKLALLLCVVVFFSCEKDDGDKKLDKNEIIEEALSNLQISYNVNFENKATDVEIFFRPVIKFENLFDEKMYHPVWLSESSRKQVPYKQIFVDINLYDVENNHIEAAVLINEDGTEIQLHPKENLPANQEIILICKYHLERYEDDGSWVKVEEKAHNTITQSFFTGVAPKNIDPKYVAYAYPVNKQLNYYQNEHKKGYIMFKPECDYGYLFSSDKNVEFYGTLTSTDGEIQRFDFTFKDQEIEFEMPKLKNETGYRLKLYYLENSNIDTDTMVLYESIFRTSRFNSFVDKMNAMAKGRGWTVGELSVFCEKNCVAVGMICQLDEMFDSYEMYKNEDFSPLIQARADRTDDWVEYVYDFMYKDFPHEHFEVDWRDTTKYGFFPDKYVFFRNPCEQDVCYEFDVEPIWPCKSVYVVHDMREVVLTDYSYMSRRFYDRPKYDNTIPITTAMKNIIEGHTPYPSYKDTFHAILEYVLPGKNIVTSQVREKVR